MAHSLPSDIRRCRVHSWIFRSLPRINPSFSYANILSITCAMKASGRATASVSLYIKKTVWGFSSTGECLQGRGREGKKVGGREKGGKQMCERQTLAPKSACGPSTSCNIYLPRWERQTWCSCKGIPDGSCSRGMLCVISCRVVPAAWHFLCS